MNYKKGLKKITWIKQEDLTLSIQNFPSMRCPVRASNSLSWLIVNGRTKFETLRTDDRGCWAGLVASNNGAAAARTTSGFAGAKASAAISTATRLTSSIFSTFSAAGKWWSSLSWAWLTVGFVEGWKLGLPRRTSSAESGLASGTRDYLKNCKQLFLFSLSTWNVLMCYLKGICGNN